MITELDAKTRALIKDAAISKTKLKFLERQAKNAEKERLQLHAMLLVILMQTEGREIRIKHSTLRGVFAQ